MKKQYRIADNIDYLDGDLKSSLKHPGDPDYNGPKIDELNSGKFNEDFVMYPEVKKLVMEQVLLPV